MRRVDTINKIFILCLVFLLQQITVEAQGWKKTFSYGLYSAGAGVLQTQDDGYLLLMNKAGVDGAISRHLTKTDEQGNELWHKPLLDSMLTSVDLLELGDGSIMVATLDIDEITFSLVKLNSSGDLLWRQNYSQTGYYSRGILLRESGDGGFILAGSRKKNSSTGGTIGDDEIFVMKTNESASFLWTKTFAHHSNLVLADILVLPNGELIFVGNQKLSNHAFYKSFLIRTDSDGELILKKEILFEDPNRYVPAIIGTSDGNIVVLCSGSVVDNPIEMILRKLDLSGNQLWEKQYNSISDAVMKSGMETTDKGFILLGHFGNVFGSDDPVLLKVDSSGNENWTKTFFPPKSRLGHLWTVLNTDDGGYVLTGGRPHPTPGAGWVDALLIKTDSSGNIYSNVIEGTVCHDENQNCLYESTEAGLARWVVKAEKEGEIFFAVSDSTGAYAMPVDTGNYELSISPYAYWQPCQASYPLQVPNFYDTLNLNLPLQATLSCPLLEVHIATPFLRFCVANTYYVQYCNYGTEEALAATVEVTLDPSLTYTSATVPLLSQIGNVYTFDVGDLDIGECGAFSIAVDVTCDPDMFGENLCVEAHVYPDSICDPSIWSGPIIEVTGGCNATEDSMIFTIHNVGTDMQSPYEYIVIEDNIILFRATYQLAFGEVETVSVLAEPDANYHLLTGQGIGFPVLLGNPITSASIAACSGNGSSIPILENDGEPFYSIFCTPIIGSFDPNDKRAFPAGWTDEHYIDTSTDLEYHIRFQNTGTDTAFQVKILDTLSSFLNPMSIHTGASSHPYEYQLLDNSVLEFTFPNIMLPDSNVNEAASHGFISFKIDQHPNNDIGTLITNSAAIYFDFNAPVITNETFHTIGEPWVQFFSVATRDITRPGLVKVYPNPLQTTALVEIPSNKTFQEGHFILYNLQGQIVQEKRFRTEQFSLNGEPLNAGIYSYEIRLDGRPYSGGKVVIVK